MAVSINTSGTYKVTRVDSADTATGWSVVKLEGSGGAPSLLASVGTIDLVAEGTDARAARTNKQRVQLKYTNAAGYDFTSGSTGTGSTKVPSGIVYIWALFLAAGSLLTEANGGMQISLGDGTNTSYWNVSGSGGDYSGGFRKWARDTSVTPSETSGTAADLGDITEIGFITDVGVNVTRFDNFVVDAIDVGDGLEIQGTTASDTLFSESATQDATTAIGVFNTNAGIVFCQGSLDLSGTALTSIGETLVFLDTLGSAYTYNLDITGTVTFTNTSISAAGSVDYALDSSGATSFTVSGGSFNDYATLVTGSGQSMSNLVLSDGGTATIANTLISSTFNQCGEITVTGGLTDCNIIESTSAVSVSAATTSNITGCSFTSDGSNHAIEITSPGTYTFNDNAFTGYATVNGSTGNEVIYNNSGGSVILNKSGGSGTLSVRNGSGASTTINESYTLTLTDIASGINVTIVNSSTRTELQHSTSTGADITYVHSGGETVDILLMGLTIDPNLSDIFDLTLPSADSSIKFQTISDTNYENP